MEFDKVSALDTALDQKGKTVLYDARAYYNSKYNNISIEEINRIAQKLGEDGFHI